MGLRKKINIFSNSLIFFSILLPIVPLSDTNAFANEQINIKSNIKENLISLNESLTISNYILGVGDVIKISFYGLEIFDAQININAEGNIHLAEIGLVKAEGKTIDELKFSLREKYKEYIYDPVFDIEMVFYRPITIYLRGEVVQPGLYDLVSTKIGSKLGLPRLYDALKKGQGFNNKANLEAIEIIRINPSNKGGGKIKTNLNLLSLFDTGDQTVNIRLYDGDIITIPKSDKPIAEQILKINRTNISPELITVFITGNAISKGPKTLKKGTSLVQAIASTGGKKLFTGDIEFIRFNYDGTTSKKTFRYNPNAKINSTNNPILMSGDLINVKRTIIGATSEYLREVSTPALSIYGLYNLILR